MNQDAITLRYIPLRAGPLSILLDRQTGGLRNLLLEPRCVWRELVVLVRDHQWQTVPGIVGEIELTQQDDSFSVRFQSEHIADELHFLWRGHIRGDEIGRIRYQFDGEALTPFAANRIGFCLLHASESCAGRRLRQYRNDGRILEGRFPDLIEPQIVGQFSICDLMGLDHEYAPGCWASATFEGDTFETEDQRNWSDASFKTYCTPLERPFPVILPAGEQRSQEVELTLLNIAPGNIPKDDASDSSADADAPDGKLRSPFLEDEPPHSQPEFGIGLCATGAGITCIDAVALRSLCEQLHVRFLRYDLVLRSDIDHVRLRQELDAVAGLCRQAERSLELVLQLPRSGAADFPTLSAWFLDNEESLHRVIVYRRGHPTTLREDLTSLCRHLNDWSVPVGGGSDAHFCELNREQSLGNFPLDAVDFVSWSLTPQVHATDDLSLMETPHSLPDMIATAQSLFGDKPLVVTPITLKPRFNAVAGKPIDDATWPTPGVDDRQSQEIAAEWTRVAWKALERAGVSSMTWYEAFGARGVASFPDPQQTQVPLYPLANALRSSRQTSPQQQ